MDAAHALLMVQDGAQATIALCDPTQALTAPVTITLAIRARAVSSASERCTVRLAAQHCEICFNPQAAMGQSHAVVLIL